MSFARTVDVRTIGFLLQGWSAAVTDPEGVEFMI
jgi:hypothetical protein